MIAHSCNVLGGWEGWFCAGDQWRWSGSQLKYGFCKPQSALPKQSEGQVFYNSDKKRAKALQVDDNTELIVVHCESEEIVKSWTTENARLVVKKLPMKQKKRFYVYPMVGSIIVL